MLYAFDSVFTQTIKKTRKSINVVIEIAVGCKTLCVGWGIVSRYSIMSSVFISFAANDLYPL